MVSRLNSYDKFELMVVYRIVGVRRECTVFFALASLES